MSLHRHEKRTEHWSIVEGIATITLGNETADYNKYEVYSFQWERNTGLLIRQTRMW